MNGPVLSELILIELILVELCDRNIVYGRKNSILNKFLGGYYTSVHPYISYTGTLRQ